MLSCPLPLPKNNGTQCPFCVPQVWGLEDGHCTHGLNGAEMDSTACRRLIPLGL